ncbi:MAG: aryl-sulfate sulfotransferase [Bacteroidota bacterium]
MIKHLQAFFLIAFTTLSLYGQNTVGLLSYDINQAYQGYTLIYPHNQPNTFLLNNCGEVVHSWGNDPDKRPGNTAYLQANGDLYRTVRPASIAGDAIWAGGGGAVLEIRNWDNDLLWSYELNNDTARLHHDFVVLPNGNIVALAWELKTNEEAIAAGRDPSKLNQINLWPDYLFEINPNTDEIVWEWHAWDHLVQDFDATKDNFGVISDNIRKIDVNWDYYNDGRADWMHANFLDYNPELDHLMLCVPHFNEVWIIDHSTTTAQAATSFGGNSNRGGDLLYRIGHKLAYQQGDTSDQLLFFPHNAHWANEFLPDDHPFKKSVICYNNQVGEDFSAVEIFNTSWSMYISDYETFNNSFPPFEFENTITHPTPSAIYSTGLSSAQLLPNGNTLICAGRLGYLVELTPDDEIAWEYKTPLMGGNAVDQGAMLDRNANLTFTAFRYPIDYEAFTGRDLSFKGYIETMPNETFCDQLTSTRQLVVHDVNLFPSPAHDMLQITWNNGMEVAIQIVDLNGRTRLTTTAMGGRKYLDISHLEKGLYFVVLDGREVRKLAVQ